MDVSILYEDDGVLVVDKPSGLIVHADGRTEEDTLCQWFVERYPQAENVGEPFVVDGKEIIRPGVVHRLDRETSGAIVLAKTSEAHAHLKEQFQNRTVEKQYVAFVHGVMKHDEGSIDRPIGKSPKDFRRWSATRGARGTLREAMTEYRVLVRGSGFSYVELHPMTGRTHQLRVHLKAINYPIVCDTLYAPSKGCALEFERLALHAKSLTYTALNGDTVAVKAPLPDDFERGLALLNN